jgi:hypothetical protein
MGPAPRWHAQRGVPVAERVRRRASHRTVLPVLQHHPAQRARTSACAPHRDASADRRALPSADHLSAHRNLGAAVRTHACEACRHRIAHRHERHLPTARARTSTVWTISNASRAGARTPAPAAKPARRLRSCSERLCACADLDTLVHETLACLEAKFDIHHTMILMLDGSGTRLYTVASLATRSPGSARRFHWGTASSASRRARRRRFASGT